ncbi:nitrite reductase large subunit NirB [Effusibacillus lacus]|uniref:Nitrite reductase large subunit n=1 Tax=Effusibacillus lacus TaxID=1348429 RepID=A0A292YR72_9BACL|nr:nitrite reductase large subunit NirB [Effusibacillus lacus]TCS76074.1 assimilatory nitrite reductase (NAD(P)H) large subunit precursor [Effusibacillus lacus]GAX91411.1 nitrite reductase large subunit [Effusibacillus lacus]
MNLRKLVLVGNGMAGVRCIEEILKLAPNRFEIAIFGSEPHPNYNRILLSSVLAGDADIRDIVLNDWNWYEQNGIKLHTGQTVTKIDTEKHLVYTDGGIVESYDDLILATGSLPFMLSLPGADKEGVIAFRDIKDCETMIEASRKYKKAIVIGGGLLGLEAARGLLNLSMEVSVVHIFDNLMERQLDPVASKMLQRELEAQGMRFLMEKHSEEILGDRRVTGLRFKDGTVEEADLIIMAVGIKPNVALAKENGIEVNRGIVVNDFLETSVPNVYAVGECAEHRGMVYGLVAPLFEQGQVLAKRICKRETDPYEGSIVYTKLKVSGVDVFSAGEFMDSPDTRAIRVHDEFAGIYKKILVRDNKVVGAVLFGDTSDSTRILQMMKNETNVMEIKRVSVLENPDSAGVSGMAAVAAMSDEEIICGCNGVSKGTIVQAIQEKGLCSVEDIKGCTGASRSCGGCKQLVAQVLESVLGDKAQIAAQKEPICSCTSLSREEVLAEIKEKHLTTVKEVMYVLGWNQEEGCSKCRPALNYYLNMLWPEEHEDERASRFVNERLHANIQKDGTYSVVPRMYGGVTSPSELKRIAEVAEKYQVPMVKVTGGQRIDLLGVKKEDLPKIWAELDMPSGFAYGKALRTVKTCVGSDFCRFGTQNSIQMGIDIEKKFERINTPAKFKMAVSGCPRNCAESGIKDLGVVGIDGGWEIYVGGNGGVHLRAGDLLCKVKTEEEVMEWTGAFMQYYRENANYGERTSYWVERVGLANIQKVLEDPETRRQLNERIDVALSVLKDPWKEIVQNEEVRAVYEELPVLA